MTIHEIDVALSYASEQDAYVRAVNTSLVRCGIVTFFAPLQQIDLWGEDLVIYLDRIYREQATICVMFISQDYVGKVWPIQERRSALNRQIEEGSSYILPVRFDDSPVPGLSSSIHYLRTVDYTPEQLSEAIRLKLRQIKSSQ